METLPIVFEFNATMAAAEDEAKKKNSEEEAELNKTAMSVVQNFDIGDDDYNFGPPPTPGTFLESSEVTATTTTAAANSEAETVVAQPLSETNNNVVKDNKKVRGGRSFKNNNGTTTRISTCGDAANNEDSNKNCDGNTKPSRR